MREALRCVLCRVHTARRAHRGHKSSRDRFLRDVFNAETAQTSLSCPFCALLSHAFISRLTEDGAVPYPDINALSSKPKRAQRTCTCDNCHIPVCAAVSLALLTPSPRPSSMQVAAFPNPVHFTRHEVQFSANKVEQEETFFVRDVPGKGKGVVAARPIKRGEFLLSEPPLFTLSPSPTNSMILGALTKCTREQQRQYFALANSYKTRLLPALAIFETNFLLLGHGNLHADRKQQEQAGIFLLASRFNSSCTPNVSKTWDELRNVMVFRTLRDVSEGEELCFNYCDVLGPQDQRKRELLQEFGFQCICTACQLTGEEALESDKRRTTISRLFEEVGKCGKEPTLGMRKIKLALKMLKDESLVHYEASFCYDAFQFCVLVSDFANAKAWIRRAWEVSLFTSGSDSNAARMFKMYWANPRSHQLAGTLPHTTLSGPDPQ